MALNSKISLRAVVWCSVMTVRDIGLQLLMY